jgi:dGTPase
MTRDDRWNPDTPPAQRTEAQRDRDRVLYSTAFRRLDAVTQVVLAKEGHLFHNRLTHSLKVAQLGRRMAENILAIVEDAPDQRVAIDELGGLDPEVVETACLAHDIGHPPFGHIGERALDACTRARGVRDGWEGNAQSFRIVTRLASAKEGVQGLNLTRASLNAILKYPRRYRMGESKWGTYDSDAEVFDWARESLGLGDDQRTLEAEIMDWADDITYAVHDVDDFYRAGMIPLFALVNASPAELAPLLDGVRNKWGKEGRDLDEAKLMAASSILRMLPAFAQYSGKTSQRAQLRDATSTLIGRYVKATTFSNGNLRIREEARLEVDVLQQLTREYVVNNPSLATQQHGQKRIIRQLFSIYSSALRRGDVLVFPPRLQEEVADMLGYDRDGPAAVRLVADVIAGMTEEEAIGMHRRLTGAELGSVADTQLI